jgi:hypothetical protein
LLFDLGYIAAALIINKFHSFALVELHIEGFARGVSSGGPFDDAIRRF